jgi:hypothetical protein
VLQLLWWSLVALKDREARNPTGNLQVAAECADDHSLCRACAGIVVTRSRSAMLKSCWPNAVCKQITTRFGVGFDVYSPELDQRLRRHLKPTNKSWRVDETYYVRIKGRWCYLYRAMDSTGATIDFLLSALRDAEAAKRLCRAAL